MASRLHEPIDIKDINLTYFCRGCKQKVRGIPLTNPQYHISPFDDDPWIVCRCPTRACELSFIIYNRLNDFVSHVYPLPYFSAEHYHEAIPKNVREDLAEADRCFYAQAYRAAVVMHRRAIQNTILDKISDKSIPDETVRDKKLWEQIDALFVNGLITKDLKETAHEIRYFGNFGAHPQDDELDNTTREDVEIIDRLTFDLMRTIYITPFETKKMKSKRANK